MCANPHNNGGSCPRCVTSEYSVDSDNDDECDSMIVSEEMLPLVESYHADIDTDSDSYSDDEQDDQEF